jgi:general secretion pathway protein K
VTRRKDEGIALILALLVLIILVVVILQMTASSLHNRTLAENHLSDLQNTYGARAGYARAMLFLQDDLEKTPEVDSLRERWATPLEFEMGKARVKVSVADSDRYINLSQLVNDKGEVNPVVASQLRRLVKHLKHTPDIADRIIDYIDTDTKGEFEARAKNDKLFNVDELLRVDGLTPEIVYGGLIQGQETKGLREFLTIWPKTPPEGSGTAMGVVNINTAPLEVLASLSDLMTVGVAEAIVAYRTQPGTDGKLQEFQKVDDLKKVQGMSDGIYQSLTGQLAVKSSTFEVRSRGTVANVEKTWVYVVQRKGGGGAPPAAGTPPAQPPPSGTAPSGGPPPPPSFTLIGAQALNDFTTAKPPEVEK